jgi:hypothetical protein
MIERNYMIFTGLNVRRSLRCFEPAAYEAPWNLLLRRSTVLRQAAVFVLPNAGISDAPYTTQ